MPTPVIAVYPGTFDPITLGHQNIIGRAAGLFDRVIVAVAAAHHKKTLFSLQERLDTVREVLQPYANVRVESFTGLVAERNAAVHAARGLLVERLGGIGRHDLAKIAQALGHRPVRLLGALLLEKTRRLSHGRHP